MAGPLSIININVGILGHVDSGKTSLVKALSTSLSTAALDKSPASKQRGITLDLGFSSFLLDFPDHLKVSLGQNVKETVDTSKIQCTLVDCPGHASLIRTIIGGAQIIDMIVLVIDVNKGIQTQTAECIVIGEMTTNRMVVVLNKIDKLPADEREERITSMTQKIRSVLATTKFADARIIAASAAVGGEKIAAATSTPAGSTSSDRSAIATQNMDGLIETIRDTMTVPTRDMDGDFYYAIDHCFAIKGHGTVLTGTILKGKVNKDAIIEIPHLKLQRRVKGIQMFRKPVKGAVQGDRVGICLTDLDPKAIERGVAATPGSVPRLNVLVAEVRKVRFHKGAVKTGSKMHVSIGHSTVLADVTFFGASEIARARVPYISSEEKSGSDGGAQSSSASKAATKHKHGNTGNDKGGGAAALNTNSYMQDFSESGVGAATRTPDWAAGFEHQPELVGARASSAYGSEPRQYALLRLQQPIWCPMGSLVIGSRLDSTPSINKAASSEESSAKAGQCRLAFYGPIRSSLSSESDVRIFNLKEKKASVFRLTDVRNGNCVELVAWKLYQKEGSVTPFLNMLVQTQWGDLGTIVGPFGSTHKFRVRFPQPGVRGIKEGDSLFLRFRRYLGDPSKKMDQEGIRFNDFVTERVPTEDTEERKPEPEKAKVYRKGDGKEKNGKEVEDDAEQMNRKIIESEVESEVRAIIEVAGKGPINGEVGPAKGTMKHERERGQGHVEPVVSQHSRDVEQSTYLNPNLTLTLTPVPLPDGRRGTIEKVKPGEQPSSQVAIVSGAFTMEENIQEHKGTVCLAVHSASGSTIAEGTLIGPFAKMGKCKVSFAQVAKEVLAPGVMVIILKK